MSGTNNGIGWRWALLILVVLAGAAWIIVGAVQSFRLSGAKQAMYDQIDEALDEHQVEVATLIVELVESCTHPEKVGELNYRVNQIGEWRNYDSVRSIGFEAEDAIRHFMSKYGIVTAEGLNKIWNEPPRSHVGSLMFSIDQLEDLRREIENEETVPMVQMHQRTLDTRISTLKMKIEEVNAIVDKKGYSCEGTLYHKLVDQELIDSPWPDPVEYHRENGLELSPEVTGAVIIPPPDLNDLAPVLNVDGNPATASSILAAHPDGHLPRLQSAPYANSPNDDWWDEAMQGPPGDLDLAKPHHRTD